MIARAQVQRPAKLLVKLVGLKRQRAESSLASTLAELESIRRSIQQLEAELAAATSNPEDFVAQKLAFEQGFVQRAVEFVKTLRAKEMALLDRRDAARSALRDVVFSEAQLKSLK